jgi:hypothetical protein
MSILNLKSDMTSNGSDIGLEPSKYRDARTALIIAATVGLMSMTGLLGNKENDTAANNTPAKTPTGIVAKPVGP